MNNSLEEARQDIAAFADDERSVELDRDGTVLFERLGEEKLAKITKRPSGEYFVEIDSQTYSYRNFISNYLGKLDIMANRLIEKRSRDENYIDSPCILQSLSLKSGAVSTLDLLKYTCSNPSAFSTRLAFVTADAGQGKTVALREFQRITAEAFLRSESEFLFWHVDLQGRQLVRLNEALMGDLGDLRMTGIYMPSIVRLIRHGMIVLAIDGFDELAVEQGSVDALGALAALVSHLEGQGSVIAASRRTFFDTDDYVKRSKILNRATKAPCEIDQLQILPWKESDNLRYLQKIAPNGIPGYGNIEETLNIFKCAVGNTGDHPLLTRPFLFTFAVRSAKQGLAPTAVLQMSNTDTSDAMESVKTFVDALIDRDVQEKWKSKEGRPYLTAEQHRSILAEVAFEMWSQQRDRIRIDVLEQLAATLLDLWGTPSPIQVMNMIKMHALLPPASDGQSQNYRKFDHPEFQNYFLAVAFVEQARKAVETSDPSYIARFLSIAQVPETVGRYSCMLLQDGPNYVERLLRVMATAVNLERKPTYLQLNVGSITPWLMNGLEPSSSIPFAAKVQYSKLAFEGTHLINRTFKDGDLFGVSFQQVRWENITFENCTMAEVCVDTSSKYENVVFQDCDLQSVFLSNGSDEQREYVPERIAMLLETVGISVRLSVVPASDRHNIHLKASRSRNVLQKLFRIYGRTTLLYESTIKTKFYNEAGFVIETLIPLLEEFDILQQRVQHTGNTPQRCWQLRRSAEEVLRSETQESGYEGFWLRLDSLDVQ